MKDIIQYIKTYYQQEFHFWYFVSVVVFLILSLIINYSLDFEAEVVDSFDNRFHTIISYFIFYAIPYFFSVLAYSFFYRRFVFYKKPGFWLLSGFILLLLTLDSATELSINDLKLIVPTELTLWIKICGSNITQTFFWIVPPVIYWLVVDRKKVPIYGLKWRKVRSRPYFFMLLLVAPFVFLASYQADFSLMYPRYQANQAADYLGISSIFTVLTFELNYGLAYVAVEFFFRGFFIFALGRYLGQGAMLPMVSVYCFIHFQKPLLEAITSIFGGLLLGIIANASGTILGGIIAHLGMAWMMELAAFYQLYVKG